MKNTKLTRESIHQMIHKDDKDVENVKGLFQHIAGFAVAALGAGVLLILFILYSASVAGLIFYKFWYWFILPVFEMLPTIGFYESVGIALFITLFKARPAHIKDEFKKDNNTAMTFIWPWVLLAVGYLIKSII